MFIVEKASGKVHQILKGTFQESLDRLGLSAPDVDVYGDFAAYEASATGQARKNAYEDRIAKKSALREAAATANTDVHSVGAMYAMYEAVNSAALSTELKAAITAYAADRGLPDKVGN